MKRSLAGKWQVDIGDGKIHNAVFPGTLDENRIGFPDLGTNQWKEAQTEPFETGGKERGRAIATRFTRHYTFEGAAKISRVIHIRRETGQRVFLEIERARKLILFIDDIEVPPVYPPSISTPYVFELSEFDDGNHRCTLISDNSYPGWPRDAIVYASAATDETQTNWNGLLGYLHLRYESLSFISSVRVYPKADKLTVKVNLSCIEPLRRQLYLSSPVFMEDVTMAVDVAAGESELQFETLSTVKNLKQWDEADGALYELTAWIQDGDKKTVRFGMRDFEVNSHGRLALNGRGIFLRSEANCAVFPESGYSPMSENEWLSILKTYQSYGVNCMRFHSHCPPEAAFTAADGMGMLMQPELSHWDPRTAFESDESYGYYLTEMEQILRVLANHPSFVMFSWGNELCASERGHRCMAELIHRARVLDSTRLYANASNAEYGLHGCDPESDFFTSQRYQDADLRGSFAGYGGDNPRSIHGFINDSYPNACNNYDEALGLIRAHYQKAVFGFEVGQFEVLPDFSEIDEFRGVSDPVNYRLIRDRVEARGLLSLWPRHVSASGELSLLAYRAEVEAALNTAQLSGLSLLGIQDFPGQGTALVGMLNAHLKAKPYPFAEPWRFASFFCAALPLVQLKKFCYRSGERLTADVRMANYAKEDLYGEATYELTGTTIHLSGNLADAACLTGELTDVGKLSMNLGAVIQPEHLKLTMTVAGISNHYSIWIYPDEVVEKPVSVYESKVLDQSVIDRLAEGATVYLTPPSTQEALPHSIQAQFTTDFWSVGTFPGQEGGMGQLIDAGHPALAGFPTETHSNWQWWPMAKQRAVILPSALESVGSIVTEMDSYAYLRPMSKFFECRCGNGKVLFSSFALQNLSDYPEARALLNSLYRYMDSDAFSPSHEVSVEWLQSLVN